MLSTCWPSGVECLRELDKWVYSITFFFFFQAEDGIRDIGVTGVQTCALPILGRHPHLRPAPPGGRRRRPGSGDHRGVRLHRPGAPGLRRHRRQVRQPAARQGGRTMRGRSGHDGPSAAKAEADPVLVEIVAGTLAAIEKEVETSIGRTSRSPMIRDAHDFRAGIHDRRLRKLTGRSYSALVHPVVRDYPIATMNVGDVYFHNDVYLSEGGIGHLPDLCVTVPVFAANIDTGSPEVVAFIQAFGHHDDIGGAVPASMPPAATSVYEEGLMVPPIKLWDRGVPNESALKIMTRNSRMPDSLAADLDAECSACLAGARRLGELFDRYGVEAVNSAFDSILANSTEVYRRGVLNQHPDRTHALGGYAEDGGLE